MVRNKSSPPSLADEGREIAHWRRMNPYSSPPAEETILNSPPFTVGGFPQNLIVTPRQSSLPSPLSPGSAKALFLSEQQRRAGAMDSAESSGVSDQPSSCDAVILNFSPTLGTPDGVPRWRNRRPSNPASLAGSETRGVSTDGRGEQFGDVKLSPTTSSRPRKFSLWGGSKPPISFDTTLPEDRQYHGSMSRRKSSPDVPSRQFLMQKRASEEEEEDNDSRKVSGVGATATMLRFSKRSNPKLANGTTQPLQKWSLDDGLEPLVSPPTFSPEGVSIVQIMLTSAK
ncbi:hypothetical protein HDU67_006656 [Dinochytrium kinnereticum]|nr:hypothetical protein HDU67_006656 [Dinochytrium kinnereticum]